MATKYNMKCVVVGNSAVGKTSLLHTYVEGSFDDNYAPTVFDKHDVEVKVGDKTVVLGLLDTAGQEGFDRLRPLSYVDSDVFLVCFAISDSESFLNVKAKWVPEVLHHEQTTPFVVVGTKADMRKTDSSIKDEKWFSRECSKLGAYDYVECSALENDNLQAVMDAIAIAGLEGLKRGNKLDDATLKKDPKAKGKAKKPLVASADNTEAVDRAGCGCVIF